MDALDLPAYFRRIGYTGAAASPDVATLGRLIALHRTAIAFENIDGLAGRVPRLDLGSLQRKLVDRRRGGHCFEQNHLFRAVLERLGYRVDGLEGRVRIGVASGGPDTPRTHMALRVTIDGVAYLVDVGLGGPTPMAALAQDERGVQAIDGESYRIVDVEHGGEPAWMMQGRADEAWQDIYLLHRRIAGPADYEVANWFVSTSPAAVLQTELILSRPLLDGTRHGLRNDRLMTRHRTGRPKLRRLTARADFSEVLADIFLLQIDDGDLDAVMATVERARGGERGH
ncbi:MAG: arylamine N-acetyltransferase [Burkholderiaceae bacterium]